MERDQEDHHHYGLGLASGNEASFGHILRELAFFG